MGNRLQTYVRKINRPIVFYAIASVVVGVVFVWIDLAKPSAPESVLVRVFDRGVIQEDAVCYGDVFAPEQVVSKKELRALASIYDFLDSASFYTNVEKGFYMLDTGLKEYTGKFEIRIVCYTSGMRGVSYTIVDNEHRNECDIREDGKVIVCSQS